MIGVNFKEMEMMFFLKLFAIFILFYGEIGAMEMPEGYRGDQNSNKIAVKNNGDNIYAETVADYTWEGENSSKKGKFWSFVINFIAEESEENALSGDSAKNHLVEVRYLIPLVRVEKVKGYKPGVKPLQHQKIRIKYEKEEPIMFGRLDKFKCRDEQGQIVELNF